MLLDQIGKVRVQEKFGEGGRSVVYSGEWRGRQVASKVCKPEGINNHDKRHELNIAEFEFQRNKAFYELPGLSGYIAQPLHYMVESDICAMICF